MDQLERSASPSRKVALYPQEYNDEAEDVAPHAESSDAILAYLYTSDSKPLLTFLADSSNKTEALIGVLKNIVFFGSSEDELYALVAQWSLPYTDDVVHSSRWNCSNIPLAFLKRWMIVSRAEDGNSSELERLMILLWWAQSPRSVAFPEGKQTKLSRLQAVLPFVQFEFIVQSQLLKELQSHVKSKTLESRSPVATAQRTYTVQNFPLEDACMTTIISHAWKTYQPEDKSAEGKNTTKHKKMHRMKQFWSKLRSSRI
jgi:hypothetical protein